MIVHVPRIVQSVEILVVVADRVNLSLCMAQFVDGLQLASYARPNSFEVAANVGIRTMRVIFERRHRSQEDLQRVDVAGV